MAARACISTDAHDNNNRNSDAHRLCSLVVTVPDETRRDSFDGIGSGQARKIPIGQTKSSVCPTSPCEKQRDSYRTIDVGQHVPRNLA